MKNKIYLFVLFSLLLVFLHCDPAGVGTPEEQKQECYEASIPIFIASATDTMHTAQEKQNILTLVLLACSEIGEY